jgi:hypothetical protein
MLPVLVVLLLATATTAQPSPPAPCGTLDLTSPLTQHCFPEGVEGATLPPPPALCENLYALLTVRFPVSHHHTADGSHHFVCCTGITLPENAHSPHGNYNPLERVIRAASNHSKWVGIAWLFD